MSLISLDALANEYPERRLALKRIEAWLRKHTERTLYPRTLARDLKQVDPYELTAALTLLTKVGLLDRVYKVVTPSGVIADGEFKDPRTIPATLPDRFNVYFDTSDADITPVFHRRDE